MAAEVISCPSCKHPVRVPESLFGQTVRCPECKAYFTAPTRDFEGKLGEPVIVDEPLNRIEQPDGDDESPANPKVSLLLPAILLFGVGFLNCALNGIVLFVLLLADPDAVRQASIDGQKEVAKILKKEFNEEEAKKMANEIAGRPVFRFWVALTVSIINVLGAVAMVTKRFRWLAILGSVAAMINFVYGCCVIGIPVGIYCLIKLADRDVKAAFARSI